MGPAGRLRINRREDCVRKHIGRVAQELRIQRGLSQNEIGRKLQRCGQLISNFERYGISKLNPALVRMYFKILGVKKEVYAPLIKNELFYQWERKN